LEVEIGMMKEREIKGHKVEVKKIVEWGEENIKLYRQREGKVRIEEENVKEIWENLKKGIKECETKREFKIRKKGSVNIAGGTQNVKRKIETNIRHIRNGRKEGKEKRSICD